MTAELRSLPLRLLGKRHPRLADAMQFAAWYQVEHSILSKTIAHKEALGLDSARERLMLSALISLPKLAHVARVRLEGKRRRPICPWLPHLASYLKPHHRHVDMATTLAHVEQHASPQLLEAWEADGDDPRYLEGATVFDNYGRAVSRLTFSQLDMAFVPASPAVNTYPPYLARLRAAQLRNQAAEAQANGALPALVTDLLRSAARFEEAASIEEHRDSCC
ncbi:MAG: hypothetical protein GX771_06535 [Halomonadaceae bacterium]|nr:hypothetical protein [Halomonadaceae bacterium]